MDEHLTASVEVPDTTARDVVDSDDPRELRLEILNLRDAIAGSAAREEVLEDRVRELELQVEDLAVELEKYSSLTSNPVVRVLLATSRPFRRFVERRRAGS